MERDVADNTEPGDRDMFLYQLARENPVIQTMI
jgi:hypothetical protein